MSMLSEPRRYRNRYNLVPRGKALYEDEDRFGTKLLKKMGWEKGKGLGSKQQGNQDFIRVRVKNDERGLGFEDRDDHWTQHEESFTGLLKSLNGNDADSDNTKEAAENDSDEGMATAGFGFKAEPKSKTEKLKEKFSGESLEEKSKRSKARVHYKKFTKGKDLSQYSEKDLANIFGKKAVEQQDANGIYQQFTAITIRQEKEENSDEKEKQQNADTELNKTSMGGVQMITAGMSVGDYFKQKMEAMKRKLKGAGASETVEYAEEDAVLLQTEVKETKSKKRKLASEEVEVEDEIAPKKKKKKSKSNEEPLLVDLQQENETLLEETSIKKKKKITEVDEVLETISKEKKRKKIKSNKETEAAELIIQEKEIVELTNVKRKNKKNKKKSDEEIVLLEESDSNINVMEEDSLATSKMKKKKCKDTKSEKTEKMIEVEEIANEISTKKKKKKSKKQQDENEIVEQTTEIITADVVTSEQSSKDLKNFNVCETKNKQKKKKCESSETTNINELHSAEQPTKKKSKKKKNSSSTTLETNKTNVSAIIDIEKHNVDDENSNAATATKELLSLDDLIAKHNSYNVYTISSFCAEKFRNTALEQFQGSNMNEINGYSVNDDFKLNIEKKTGDEESITKFWNCTLDKYRNAEPKSVYRKYMKDVYNARKAKAKPPRFNVKSLKRKRIFQGI